MFSVSALYFSPRGRACLPCVRIAVAFPAAHTSNQIHFPTPNIRCDFLPLPSYLQNAALLIPVSRFQAWNLPKMSATSRQALASSWPGTAGGCWWHRGSPRHSPAPTADIQGCAVLGFLLFSLGSTTSALSLHGKERGLYTESHPSRVTGVEELQSHPGWTLLP